MKTARLFLPVASFAAAALVARFWPGASGPAPSPGMAHSAPVSPGVGKSKTMPGQTIVAARGIDPPMASPVGTTAAAPTMEEVFAATGLDRMLLMARFIQTASGEELKAVIDRAEEDQIYETAFTDQVWLRWVEVDLEAALKHHRGGNAWWAYAKMNPQAALSRSMAGAKNMLSVVLRSIGQGDPNLARKHLAEVPEMEQEVVLRGVFEGMEKVDPAAATALALEKDASMFLESQFNNWMRQDPEQALAWMRALTNPADRRRVEDLAMGQLISTDPATGLKAVLKLPPGLGQTTRTVEAISALARQNPAAARAAADALPSPYARQKALAALAVSLASQGHTAVTVDLVSSLDWDILAKSRQSQWSYVTADGKGGGSGYSGEDASETILTQSMTAAPQVTADALASPLSGPNVRNESNHITERLGTAVEKWAAVQPEEASAWLKNYPPGAARDAGIEGLTTWLISGSPEPDFAAALAWAGAATHEQQQLWLYENTISSWRRKDPQAAAAALENLPLSSSQRDRLNQLLLISQPAPIAK